MILIDLQKAFDTIGHNIFLNKLNCLCFSESTIAWYKSYLEEWYFRVSVEESEQAKLVCGVPQGSFLGPLIFLIYASDMSQAVDCDLYLYADDFCLVYTGKYIKDMEANLNINSNCLCDWFVKIEVKRGDIKIKEK